MDILGQLPSISAFASLGLPALFDLPAPVSPLAGASVATADSFDRRQQSQVLGAIGYRLGAAVLSSSVFNPPASSADGLLSILRAGSGAANSRSVASQFLQPALPLSLTTPTSRLSVGSLIDLFA